MGVTVYQHTMGHVYIQVDDGRLIRPLLTTPLGPLIEYDAPVDDLLASGRLCYLVRGTHRRRRAMLPERQ